MLIYYSSRLKIHTTLKSRDILILEKEPTPIYMDVIIKPGHTHAHHQVEFLLKTPNYDLVTHVMN